MKFLIFIAVIAAIIFYFYNRVVVLRQAVISSEAEISVQLDRRGKVFDSLLATVKKYLSHEDSLFSKITALRSQATTGDPAAARSAEEELSRIISSGAINIAVENYPELRSVEIMANLQEEIVTTENKLSFAKRGYNGSLERFRAFTESIPAVFIVKMFNNLRLDDKDYWRLDEETIQTEEKRRISFDD